MRSEWISIGPKRQKTTNATTLLARIFAMLLCYVLVKIVVENDDWFLSFMLSLLLLIFGYALCLVSEIKFNVVSRTIVTSVTWFGWRIKKRIELPITDFSYIYLMSTGNEARIWQVSLFSTKHSEIGLSTAMYDKEQALAEAERLSHLLGVPNRGFVTFKGGFSQ
ncbi:hypothetical protein HQ393_01255 [Chitinibacter bivalviorum]|uniref:Uncharacterized protein n=1 Tax=Chitinibacter bivalviorum TaxID=2739434 RepID=A0A7H9BEJ9_9NEIS|nr:hypothetical protein [Chitinibacter bivalviorum]QLG86977.1 hypothetical protein HQ393_01255 [Chitinibacter bivalviorum]